MARRLANVEAARSGVPITTALKTLSRRLAVAPGRIWSLLYRPPAEVGAGLYFALVDAVEREARLEIERLEHELAAARQIGGSSREVQMAEIEAMAQELRRKLKGE